MRKYITLSAFPGPFQESARKILQSLPYPPGTFHRLLPAFALPSLCFGTSSLFKNLFILLVAVSILGNIPKDRCSMKISINAPPASPKVLINELFTPR